MCENFSVSLTLLDVVRQWPVASNIAGHLPAGSLINLARSSSSLREALHAFGPSRTLEAPFTSDRRAPAEPADLRQYVGSHNVLHIGDHRTPYWEGLKRMALFKCSSKTHTKGENTRSCLYCSMPICESCIVKHSFGKNEGTFKNRCRFMCQRCWDTGNLHRARRYSGIQGTAAKSSHKSAGEARNFCLCTSKDGWICNNCKENQNNDAKADGSSFCSGNRCGAVLDESKDRRKVCLWCDKPVPRGHASMESKVAFDQKMMDARKRDLSSQMAELQEYQANRWIPARMSRREMRGDNAVKDDPDADVPQFCRNLEILNYRAYYGCVEPTADEIYRSRHGQWKYNIGFLKSFRTSGSRYWDYAWLKHATSYETPDGSTMKTNMELRRRFSNMRLGTIRRSTSPIDASRTRQKQILTRLARKIAPRAEGPTEGDEEQRLDDEDILVLQDDEAVEARSEIRAPADPETPALDARVLQSRLESGLPEYGTETLILQTPDGDGSG